MTRIHSHLMSDVTSRRVWLATLLGLIWLLGGCSRPPASIETAPNVLTLLPGDSGTVGVDTTINPCQEDQQWCADWDLNGQVFTYVLEHLPAGVSYDIDTSLQSPSTPGVARITLKADQTVSPGNYDIVIRSVISSLAFEAIGTLQLRMVPVVEPAVSTAAATIAAGNGYSFAVLADQTLWAWGDNGDGQLGLGDRRRRLYPTQVQIPVGVQHAKGGRWHSLAVGTDGSLWSWGANTNGRLGVGDRADHVEPVRVLGLNSVQTVATGDRNSLASDATGNIWYWGDNFWDDDVSGVPEPILYPTPLRDLYDRPLKSIKDIETVSGRLSLIALAADGTVWNWRLYPFYSVTPGGIQTWRTPSAKLTNIHAIASGYGHSLALAADGTVRAWGDNVYGQLGDGTGTAKDDPVTVIGLTGIQAIAAADDYSLALDAFGTVWAWGSNGSGTIDMGQDRNKAFKEPVPVPWMTGVKAIAASDSHAIALLDCGQVWQWGALQSFGVGGAAVTPILVRGFPENGRCDRFTLQIDTAGDGSGEVITDVGSMACNRIPRFSGVEIKDHCVRAYDRGTVVTLSASAYSNSVFEGWAGDCQGADPSLPITLDRSKQCVARFRDNQPPVYRLHMSPGPTRVSSSGGGVSGPPSIDCGTICDAIFPAGAAVALTSDAADRGFRIIGWSGDCTGTSSQSSVTMDGPKSCSMDVLPYALNVAVTGNGRVTNSAAGIDCGTTCVYRPGVGTVALTATPDAGWQFAGWGGDCTGTSPSTDVVMNADKSCQANFSSIAPALPTVTLSVVDASASEAGADPGVFRISRTGSNANPLTVDVDFTGSSAGPAPFDYLVAGVDAVNSVTIPAGADYKDVVVTPQDDPAAEPTETVKLTLQPSPVYELGATTTGTISIFDNDTVAFADAQNLGDRPVSDLALGDVDGDGDLDMVAARPFQSDSSQIWVNQGRDQNGNWRGFLLGTSLVSGHIGAALGDLDADGDTDIVLLRGGSPINRYIEIYLNQGRTQGGAEGAFLRSPASDAIVFPSVTPEDFAVGDLDGDGDLDLFVTTSSQNAILLNTGTGALGNPRFFGQGFSGGGKIVLADIDGDGNLPNQDLDAYTSRAVSGDRLWINQAGNFVEAIVGTQSNGIAFGDLDGDNDPDAVFARQFSTDQVYLNQAGVLRLDTRPQPFPASGNSRSVAVGYLNDDAYADVFFGASNGENRIYQNDKSGLFQAPALVVGTAANNVSSDVVVIKDLDQNGKADVAAATGIGVKIWLQQ